MIPRLLIDDDSVTVFNSRADEVDASDSLRTSRMRELGGLRMIERETDVQQPVV